MLACNVSLQGKFVFVLIFVEKWKISRFSVSVHFCIQQKHNRRGKKDKNKTHL
ncbi:unnamed protein product [Brassica oleracea]